MEHHDTSNTMLDRTPCYMEHHATWNITCSLDSHGASKTMLHRTTMLLHLEHHVVTCSQASLGRHLSKQRSRDDSTGFPRKNMPGGLALDRPASADQAHYRTAQRPSRRDLSDNGVASVGKTMRGWESGEGAHYPTVGCALPGTGTVCTRHFITVAAPLVAR